MNKGAWIYLILFVVLMTIMGFQAHGQESRGIGSCIATTATVGESIEIMKTFLAIFERDGLTRDLNYEKTMNVLYPLPRAGLRYHLVMGKFIKDDVNFLAVIDSKKNEIVAFGIRK